MQSPISSVYYLGGKLIEYLENNGGTGKKWDLELLYKGFEKWLNRDVGFTKFVYTLDWLFILGKVSFNSITGQLNYDSTKANSI